MLGQSSGRQKAGEVQGSSGKGDLRVQGRGAPGLGRAQAEGSQRAG